MSFRLRIASWVVGSCILLVAVMTISAYRHLEEELRRDKVDPHHPHYEHWKIHNTYEEEEIRDILGEMLGGWLFIGGIATGLSLVAGLLLARRSLQPVHHINHQIAAMRPDSLRGGIVIPEADPAIANLVAHLNTLLDKSGTAYQEMAEFSARVAHELRTPLMLLRMRVEHAPPGLPPAFQEELQDELARLSRFVERALVATKAERGALEPIPVPVDLSALLDDLSESYRLLAEERELRMDLEIAPSLVIDADPDLLRQLLHGLLENAVRYASARISCTCQLRDGHPELEIANDVDPATTAPSGLGLGLRIARGICKASGFQLDLTPTPNHFQARVRFPQGPSDNPQPGPSTR